MTLLAAGGLALTPIEEEELKTRMAKIASKFRLQGEWRLVAEMLTIPLSPGAQLEVIIKHFGSLRPLLGRKKTLIAIYRGLKRVPLWTTRVPRVKPTQRKRGYDDKGHLRRFVLNNPRYWITPRTEEVRVELTETAWLPEEYVLQQEAERETLAGGPGGEDLVLPERAEEIRLGGLMIFGEEETDRTSDRNDRREDLPTGAPEGVPEISPRGKPSGSKVRKLRLD